MANLYGTTGPNTITGGATADYISGGPAGNEAADTGNDSLSGDGGNDTIRGWGGNDTLAGQAGTDNLDGGDGNDRLVSDGNGDDNFTGGAGDDRFAVALTRDANQDLTGITDFAAGAGGEVVDLSTWGFSEFDTVLALSGNVGGWLLRTYTNNVFDQVFLAGVPTGVVVAANFVLTTAATNDTITGAAGRDDLFGALGNDNISGLAGTDRLFGEQGDDTLDGGAGNDTLYGSTGQDSLLGGTENDSLLGGTGNDTLAGQAGTDNLDGGDGNDRLVSDGNGDDNFTGGAGDDRFAVALTRDANQDLTGITDFAAGAGGEVVDLSTWGFSEFDTVLALSGNVGGWLLRTYTNNVFDQVFLAGVPTGVVVAANFVLTTAATNDTITGAAGRDDLFGALGNDNISGLAGTDRLFGEQGDDTLDGGAGNDTLYGSTGNDTYVVDSASDNVIEERNEGIDTVIAAVNYTLGSTLEHLELSGAADVRGGGNGGDNVIRGNAGRNALSGGGGDDSLVGAAGKDKLNGGNGNDTLEGGDGADKLTGGNDADAFFYRALGGGIDRIADFIVGEDIILVASAAIGGALPAGPVAPGNFAVDSPSAAAPQFVYDSALGVLSWDADGTGGGNAARIASGLPLLSASDIVIA